MGYIFIIKIYNVRCTSWIFFFDPRMGESYANREDRG